MPQTSVRVFVPCPPEQAFVFLADACNLPLWHSGVEDASWLDSKTYGIGCGYAYRFPGRRRSHRLECCLYEPPTRLAFRGERMWTPVGSQVPLFAFRLSRVPDGRVPDGQELDDRALDDRRRDGCEIEIQVTTRLAGGLLLLWPVVAHGWRRDLPADAHRLRELLSSVVAPDPEWPRPRPGSTDDHQGQSVFSQVSQPFGR